MKKWRYTSNIRVGISLQDTHDAHARILCVRIRHEDIKISLCAKTVYKLKKTCYITTTMRKIHIPYNKNNKKYFYSCPYYGEFLRSKPYPIPTCKTATALTIYYQFFYRDSCIAETNTRLLPFHRYILWAKHYTIKPTNEFAILIDFLCHCNFTTLPLKGQHLYKKEKEFYAEARKFILDSHKWDWVVPHLKQIYPQLLFGDLNYETN